MEIDSPDDSTESMSGNQNGNGINLYPVSVGDGGVGLPYAPMNFPNPGDQWSWKVGRRIAASGYFLDRYLYPPNSLRDVNRRKQGFASKQSVEQFIRSKVPNADANAFFASFSWRIPSNQLRMSELTDHKDGIPTLGETTDTSASDFLIGDAACKAGNRSCSSLIGSDDSTEVMFCDICCSEPDFCRDCCCILCCKRISSDHGGYSYFRCEALVNGSICGHVAHINCGLRAYLAGTVGGTIGLDAEYYCRRCDSRSDLVLHVEKLLKICQSMESRDIIEMILNVGICVLRGSERTSALQLLDRVSSALSKLRNESDFDDIWKEEDRFEDIPGRLPPAENGATDLVNYEGPPEDRSPPVESSIFDHRVEAIVLEDEIDQILLELKKSQELEYRLAEEILHSQKNRIHNLYQQLNDERHELSKQDSSANAEVLIDAILGRVEEIKKEVTKLKEMKSVSKGFGRTPRRILKEHYGLETENQ